MRVYDYENCWSEMLVPDIVSLLTTIHEFRGKETLYRQAKKDALDQLMEIAKIQSTDASNRIEGIFTKDERLKKIVMDKTTPKSRNEKEIAGYRDVLTTIHNNYQHIPVKSSSILQIHKELYKFSGSDIGGNYKSVDNNIVEIDNQGNKNIRFQPIHAWETGDHMEKLCLAFEQSLTKAEIDPLIILPMFILDFLCIHPFSDGNGRMSRLLTLLLLYKNGYNVGRYISIEKIINDTKESYYESLQQSSFGWHESKNTYIPFVKYLLGVVVAAYKEFSDRVYLFDTKGLSKQDRVREIIKENLGTITKRQIMEKCPDISHITIQRALKDLQEKGDIIKINNGRYTKYVWNEEKK